MVGPHNDDVAELRSEIATLRDEVRALRAIVEQMSSEARPRPFVDASHIRPNVLQLTTREHELFNVYGSLKAAILHLLSQHEGGLSVAEISSKLHDECGLSIKPNTPSSILYRLKRDGLVAKSGRAWVRTGL